MKYKNRLIVPTVVTLSLLGLTADVSADEKNDISSSIEISHSPDEEDISDSTESTKNNDIPETEISQKSVTKTESKDQNNLIHTSGSLNNSNDVSENETKHKPIKKDSQTTAEPPADVKKSTVEEKQELEKSSFKTSSNSLAVDENKNERTQKNIPVENESDTKHNKAEIGRE